MKITATIQPSYVNSYSSSGIRPKREWRIKVTAVVGTRDDKLTVTHETTTCSAFDLGDAQKRAASLIAKTVDDMTLICEGGRS